MSDKPKQVIVMRTDLNMRKGKMIAQGSHSSIGFLSALFWSHNPSNTFAVHLSDVEKEWLADGLFTKICVRVDSEEQLLALAEQAKAADIQCVLIQDSGLTEFGGVPTYTCLALGPDYASRLDPLTGELKLL